MWGHFVFTSYNGTVFTSLEDPHKRTTGYSISVWRHWSEWVVIRGYETEALIRTEMRFDSSLNLRRLKRVNQCGNNVYTNNYHFKVKVLNSRWVISNYVVFFSDVVSHAVLWQLEKRFPPQFASQWLKDPACYLPAFSAVGLFFPSLFVSVNLLQWCFN